MTRRAGERADVHTHAYHAQARVLLDRRVQIRLVSILRAWYGYAEKLRNEMCQRKVVEDAAAAASVERHREAAEK